MLHCRSTLIFKLLIPLLFILRLLPLSSHHCPTLLAVLLRLLPPLSHDSLKVLQWNAGDLQARSTKLLHFFSSHPVDLFCIQEFHLNSSSFLQIPGFPAKRYDRTHYRSDILSRDATHVSDGVITFLRQAEPTIFLLLFFPPPEISSFCETSTAIIPSGTQEVLPTPWGETIRLGHLFCSMILTYLPFYVAHLAVAPPLTFPLLLPLLPFLAPRRCFKTWVLTTYKFFHLSLSLSPVLRPNERPPSFNFQKARWDDFVFYFDCHCPSAEEYSCLSLSSGAALYH